MNKIKSIVSRIIRILLDRYVEWERMWYKPKCKFKHGNRVKQNWKFKANFPDHFHKDDVWTFDKIDSDNVVDTIEGETYCLYWLCAE